MSWRTRSSENARLRQLHKPIVQAFCEDMDFEWHYVHGFEWHIRVENVLDVFPTRRKWHFLPTGERGGWADYDELGRIMAERLGAK